MVISEKQVADQLKAFNIGFKPTKEQVEEALLFIDAVRVNHPDKYKKYQKDIFDPYEEKVQSLESDYGVFQHSIVLEASVAEKALLKQVDENNEKAKMESTTNIKPAVESIQQKYTDRMLPTFSDRIKSAQEKLKNGNDRAKKLAELLAIALKDTSASNVSRLQEEMIKDRPSVKVSSNNFPDGKFGPLTMDSLTNIADGKVQELPVSTTTDKPAQNTPENNTKQPTSLVANVKTKMRSAGEAVADMVSGTAHAETVKNSPKAPAVSSGPKAAPQNGFALKDGTKVQGMYVKEGRMWFIGAKGERKELNPSLLPDRVNAKEITAINENAKKLTSLVSDVELVLQATANHAKIANWPNPQSWENKLVELGNMLQTLDISDENKARRAILDFVQAVPVAKGNLSKEFAEIFNFADNDTERHARVYKYIRGSWYNPTASGAGFNGWSEMLSDRIASAELLKQKIGPKELEAFVAHWMNANWSNASDEAVTVAIIQSAKNAGGAFKYVADIYGAKGLPDFVKGFRSSVKQFIEAYKDPKIDTELAKVIKTEDEREKYKRESRNAKLMTLLGSTVLARDIKNNPKKRDGNFELDTFANINGTGALEISDSTAKYIRNDLWKDVAIEVAAIGAGALTAGLGTAAIHALAAGRWAVRAGEVARIGIRAEQVAARVVVGGGGFEVGHVAARKWLTGQDIFTREGYSTEGFLQSMAFAGAFEVAGKILKIAKVPRFDPTKTILEQKTLLAKYVWADALASLGVSYGISWKHGEDYTFQEAIQAITMAAFFRTAMTRAEGVKFRVKKNGPEVVVEPVSETISTQAAEIYHVLDLAEPGYQAFKKWYFSFPPVKLAAMIDAWFRKLWIPGKAYGLASDGAQKLSGFAIEWVLGGALRSSFTAPDILLNLVLSARKNRVHAEESWINSRVKRSGGNAIRSVLLADRRTSEQYIKDITDKNLQRKDGKEISVKDRRWMDPVALCVLGTLAAFNHKSQDLSEWAEEVLYAMVRGGFLTTMYNQEIPATINVPGVRNPFKPASKSEVNEKIQTQNKTVAPKTEAPQTQTTPPVVSEVKEEETAKEPEKTETETI